MCNNGITQFYVPPTQHTFTPYHTIPTFTPQLLGFSTFWLVLIAPTHEGMTRLS